MAKRSTSPRVKAALTRKRRGAGAKAAQTRKHRAAAARTRAPGRAAAIALRPLSQQEEQLVEVLREQEGCQEDFSILIEHSSGAWDITTGRGKHQTRGTGATFAQAWGNDQPTD